MTLHSRITCVWLHSRCDNSWEPSKLGRKELPMALSNSDDGDFLHATSNPALLFFTDGAEDWISLWEQQFFLSALTACSLRDMKSPGKETFLCLLLLQLQELQVLGGHLGWRGLTSGDHKVHLFKDLPVENAKGILSPAPGDSNWKYQNDFFLPSSMKRTARGQVSLQHVLVRKHLGEIVRVEGVDATRYVPVIKVWDAGLKHTQTLTVWGFLPRKMNRFLWLFSRGALCVLCICNDLSCRLL